MPKKKVTQKKEIPAPEKGLETAIEKPKVETPKPSSALSKILKQQAAIMKAADCTPPENHVVEVMPTGLDVLDHEVLGVGGLPRGKIIEISGRESSGKTAFALYVAGQVQKNNPDAVVKIYDAEHSTTDAWLESMGLDLTDYGGGIKRTIIPEFLSAEHMADQIHEELATAPPDIIIIDSLAVLMTKNLQGKDISEYNPNDNRSRAAFLTVLFNSLLNGFTYPPGGKNPKHVNLGRARSCLMCINHVKSQPKQIAPGKTILEDKTVGGVSLDFCASLRLGVRRRGYIYTGDVVTHQKIEVKSVKNKVAPPLRTCELQLSFDGGLKEMGGLDYLQLAINKGKAEVKGSWVYSDLLQDKKIQGKEAFNEAMHNWPEARDFLLKP